MAKYNVLKVFAVMPLILQLIDLVMQIAKTLQPEPDPKPTTLAESLEAAEAVGEPAPPDVEFMPIDSIFVVPFAKADQFPFDPKATMRQEWYDDAAEADDPEEGTITYPFAFGVDANNNPVMRPLTVAVDQARKANIPNTTTGNVDNRPYRRIPCRQLYSWERIERAGGFVPPLPGIGAFRIRNLAYQPPANEPTEFTEGDRKMLAENNGLLRKLVSALIES